MKVCLVSANLGAYDQHADWPEQRVPPGVVVEVKRLTDENFPRRAKAMAPALQAGIPKWFAHDLFPGFDVYLWCDASCVPEPGAVEWFLLHLMTGVGEMALFQHPDRATIREEYAFIATRMARPGETYLNGRYRGEWLEEQFAVIKGEGYGDAPLFASTAFAYYPTDRVRAAMKETWFGKTRWHLHDQLYFAYAVAKARVPVKPILCNYLKCPALRFARGHRRVA